MKTNPKQLELYYPFQISKESGTPTNMEFIKKHLFDLIGWLIGVLGVVATLLVFWFTEENIFKIVFSAILAFEFVLELNYLLF